MVYYRSSPFAHQTCFWRGVALTLGLTVSAVFAGDIFPAVVLPEEIVTRGTLTCQAQWNELCEDKKILSVPEHYQLCHYTLRVNEQSGNVRYQVVGQDHSSLTVYFSAKGSQDRFKQQAASLSLAVDLSGVKQTETCNTAADLPVAMPAVTAPAPVIAPVLLAAATPPPASAAPAPTTTANTTENTTGNTTPNTTAPGARHACACSQWLNWMKVEHCLAKGPGKEGPPCDSYNAVIQCVSSRDECRVLQKENCPQVVGLNQTTSMKRLFVANSPLCP